MSQRIKPLGAEGLGKERLKRKVGELWGELVKLQTEVYDLEEIHKRQEYDVSFFLKHEGQGGGAYGIGLSVSVRMSDSDDKCL